MEREGQATCTASVWLDGLGSAIRDAVVLTICAGVVGMLVNLVHPERIPFVAGEAYEVLVPCPEPGGDIAPVDANDPLLLAPETLLVDARGAEEHAAWRLGDATNVPYDYLDPTPPDVIAALARQIARSRAQRAVVYGDGEAPDTGEQLAKEISASGIKNVLFVRGGAPALERAIPKGGGQ
jgi:hypothetical protein